MKNEMDYITATSVIPGKIYCPKQQSMENGQMH